MIELKLREVRFPTLSLREDLGDVTKADFPNVAERAVFYDTAVIFSNGQARSETSLTFVGVTGSAGYNEDSANQSPPWRNGYTPDIELENIKIEVLKASPSTVLPLSWMEASDSQSTGHVYENSGYQFESGASNAWWTVLPMEHGQPCWASFQTAWEEPKTREVLLLVEFTNQYNFQGLRMRDALGNVLRPKEYAFGNENGVAREFDTDANRTTTSYTSPMSVLKPFNTGAFVAGTLDATFLEFSVVPSSVSAAAYTLTRSDSSLVKLTKEAHTPYGFVTSRPYDLADGEGFEITVFNSDSQLRFIMGANANRNDASFNSPESYFTATLNAPNYEFGVYAFVGGIQVYSGASINWNDWSPISTAEIFDHPMTFVYDKTNSRLKFTYYSSGAYADTYIDYSGNNFFSFALHSMNSSVPPYEMTVRHIPDPNPGPGPATVYLTQDTSDGLLLSDVGFKSVNGSNLPEWLAVVYDAPIGEVDVEIDGRKVVSNVVTNGGADGAKFTLQALPTSSNGGFAWNESVDGPPSVNANRTWKASDFQNILQTADSTSYPLNREGGAVASSVWELQRFKGFVPSEEIAHTWKVQLESPLDSVSIESDSTAVKVVHKTGGSATDYPATSDHSMELYNCTTSVGSAIHPTLLPGTWFHFYITPTAQGFTVNTFAGETAHVVLPLVKETTFGTAEGFDLRATTSQPINMRVEIDGVITIQRLVFTRSPSTMQWSVSSSDAVDNFEMSSKEIAISSSRTAESTMAYYNDSSLYDPTAELFSYAALDSSNDIKFTSSKPAKVSSTTLTSKTYSPTATAKLYYDGVLVASEPYDDVDGKITVSVTTIFADSSALISSDLPQVMLPGKYRVRVENPIAALFELADSYTESVSYVSGSQPSQVITFVDHDIIEANLVSDAANQVPFRIKLHSPLYEGKVNSAPYAYEFGKPTTVTRFTMTAASAPQMPSVFGLFADNILIGWFNAVGTSFDITIPVASRQSASSVVVRVATKQPGNAHIQFDATFYDGNEALVAQERPYSHNFQKIFDEQIVFGNADAVLGITKIVWQNSTLSAEDQQAIFGPSADGQDYVLGAPQAIALPTGEQVQAIKAEIVFDAPATIENIVLTTDNPLLIDRIKVYSNGTLLGEYERAGSATTLDMRSVFANSGMVRGVDLYIINDAGTSSSMTCSEIALLAYGDSVAQSNLFQLQANGATVEDQTLVIPQNTMPKYASSAFLYPALLEQNYEEGVDSMSFSAWVKVSGAAKIAQIGSSGFAVSVTPRKQLRVVYNTLGDEHVFESLATVVMGTWCHVAVTINSDYTLSDAVTMLIDGKPSSVIRINDAPGQAAMEYRIIFSTNQYHDNAMRETEFLHVEAYDENDKRVHLIPWSCRALLPPGGLER